MVRKPGGITGDSQGKWGKENMVARIHFKGDTTGSSCNTAETFAFAVSGSEVSAPEESQCAHVSLPDLMNSGGLSGAGL